MGFSLKDSACVYVHWNKSNLLEEIDLLTINLISQNVDHVLVVQNMDHQKSLKNRVSLPSNSELVQRKNLGYDFGAYQFGINYLGDKIKHLGALYLCNNSILPVKKNLFDLFRACSGSKYDLLGLTESDEIQWHLQSYFLRFSSKILQSSHFSNWWNSSMVSNNKDLVVNSFEIKLAEYFVTFGFTAGSLWPKEKIANLAFSDYALAALDPALATSGRLNFYDRLINDKPFNPTHKSWNLLLEAGFPFIKKDLIAGRVYDELSQKSWRNFISDSNIEKLILTNI